MANQNLYLPMMLEDKIPLIRRDLLHYEDVLCQDLAQFIQFEGHALYFPMQDERNHPEYLENEQKLLLPLRRNGALLAIMLLRQVRVCNNDLTFLENVVKLCLDKIYLLKIEGIDEHSMLMRSQRFMQHVVSEVNGVRRYFAKPIRHTETEQSDQTNTTEKIEIINNNSTKDITGSNNRDKTGNSFLTHNDIDGQRHSSVGVMVLPILGLKEARKKCGYMEARKLTASLAHKISSTLPEEAYCTLWENESLAIVYPGASRRTMEHLSQQCAQFEVVMQSAITGMVQLRLCAGYALFPQDWDGGAESQISEEIPYLLIEKASIAAQRLKNIPSEENPPLSQINKVLALRGAGTNLGYQQILLKGGHIDTILPFSQVRLDLGRVHGVWEGMCFSVWHDVKQTQYKGEVNVKRVGEETCEADILTLDNPSQILHVGDSLSYLPQSRFPNVNLDENKIFYGYRNFMDVMNARINDEKINHFSLLLLRIQWETPSSPQNQNPKMLDIAKFINEFFNTCHNDSLEKNLCPHALGQMSFNSLYVFLPHPISEQKIPELHTALQNQFNGNSNNANDGNVDIAIGISTHPYLTYRSQDMWEGCRMALDYALLLPEPHIGQLDSLAINISADRKFSQNDIFGAIEEYRMALLADPDNVLAWNSLGVCLADIKRHSEALQAFEEAYARQNDDASTCYNLGTANLALEAREKAKEFFLACLNLDSKHLFARIRLGEIAEKENELGEALEQYEIAIQKNPKSSMPYRALGKLYMTMSKRELARENLQLALQKDPNDAISLQLLASIYLDSKEDAQLAESLARQSVALAPWWRAGWLDLIRALETQGKNAEALEVRRTSIRV